MATHWGGDREDSLGVKRVLKGEAHMSGNNIPTKNGALALNQKVIQGVEKHFAKVKNVTFGGATYTPAALKATLQAEIDGNEALEVSQAQVKEQVAAIRPVRAKARSVRNTLRSYILATYGTAAVQMLTECGMNAPKPPGGKRTTEEKAAAAAQATVTRKARAAARKLVVTAPSAAQATSPAHVAPASPPAQTAAPAATSTPQQQ
jgi:hypothetical protein